MAKRVIVVFPQFDGMEIIEELRRKFDPLAHSVAAHITLVAPFEIALSTEEMRTHIEEVLKDMSPFPIVMQNITGHEGEYLFLNIKRGNDEIIALRDRLYSGVLASHLRTECTFVPHLTVGRLPNYDAFVRALGITNELQTTFFTDVHRILVYQIQNDGARPIEFAVDLA